MYSNLKNRILLIIISCLFLFETSAQILNQPATWPNALWAVTGTYDAGAVLADPTVDANFSYDDDFSGSGSTDIFNGESPIIDLSPAFNGGETAITVTYDYDYNLGNIFDLEYYDVDLASWVLWDDIVDNSSETSNWCAAITPPNVSSSELDISGFTGTQRSGFRYRFAYDASSVWGWGFCVSSPTISSSIPTVPPAGAVCTDPLLVTSLPYNTTDDTNGYGDDYGTVDEICNNSSYMTGDDVVYAYTPMTNENVDIVLTGTGTWTGVFVYEGCNPFVTCVGSNTASGGNPSISGLGLTGGTTYYIVISTWSTPQSTAYILDISVPTCVVPTFTLAQGTNDCPVGTMFYIDVDVTALGTATSVDITNDGGAPMHTAVEIGSYSVGPFAPGTAVMITVADNGDPSNCNETQPLTTASVCPPINDDCDGALTLMVNSDLSCVLVTSGTIEGATASTEDPLACSGTEDDDVWFSFIATDATHKIELLNILNGTSDLYHSLWEGTCPGSLTLVGGTCSDPNSQTVSGLSIGNTYFLRVYSWTSTAGQTTTFDVCIGTNPPPPPEDVCGGAINIPVASGMCGTMTVGNNSGATDSDFDVPAPPAATCSSYSGGDIWFSLFVPASGSVTISGDASPGCCSYLWYEVYEGSDCSSLLSIACSSTTGNDPSQFEMELTGRTPGETLWIRAWDSSNDNGPGDFNFCAYDPPSCLPPSGLNETNVTTTTADLNWTQGGTENLWNVEWGLAGFTLGSGTQQNGIPTELLQLTLLSPETDYDWYVRADCTGGDLSPWAMSSFSTTPNPPDCAMGDILICGNSVTTPDLYGTGVWNPDNATNGVCYSTPGKEKAYRFTATVTGMHTLNITASSGSGYIDYFYRGDGVCEEANWICIDDNNGTGTDIFGPLTAGIEYYILIDVESTTTTMVHDFQIDCPAPPPVNDDCANAMMVGLQGAPGSVMGQSMLGATPTVGLDGMCADGTIGPNDIWYEVETDVNGGILIITITPDGGSSATYVVGIYGNDCGNLIELSSDCTIGAAGQPSTATLDPANLTDRGSSSSRQQVYLVRVYEQTNTDDDFSVSTSGTALPITFNTINAYSEGTHNVIKWSTLIEINTEFMIVERSTDGINNWSEIGRMDGHTYSTSLQSYELIDAVPLKISYYRIKGLDRDGKYEYSKMVFVDRTILDSQKGLINIYPIPTTDKIIISTNVTTDQMAIIRITDISGLPVMYMRKNISAGFQNLELDISSLANGVYFTAIISDSIIETVKIVKQ